MNGARLTRLFPVLLAVVLTLVSASARAATLCSLNSNLADFAPQTQSTGQTAMAPMTMVLPPGGNAFMAFHQPLQNNAGLQAAPANLFLIFETDAPLGNSITTVGLPIISIAPAGENAPSGFSATDSVQIQFKIKAQLLPLWGNRHFTIIACDNTGKFIAWGRTVARGSNPDVAYAISTFVALAVYGLAMWSVYGLRRRKNRSADAHLKEKYPALFEVKPLRLRDLWNPIYLAEDSFHQASVQKLQVLLFSFLVAWLLLSLVLRTGTLVDLSPTVVGLMGISGIGAATAHIAYQNMTRLSFDNWAWLQRHDVILPPRDGELPSAEWKQLFMTGQEFNIYKLQTIVFSITVAIAMVVAGGSSLSSFTVPDNLLGILGLSQVVYVGGVLVQPPAVGDLDDALTKLRNAAEMVAQAKLLKTDTGADGKLLLTSDGKPQPLPAGQAAGANAARQYNDMAADVLPMIETALGVEASVSGLQAVILAPDRQNQSANPKTADLTAPIQV